MPKNHLSNQCWINSLIRMVPRKPWRGIRISLKTRLSTTITPQAQHPNPNGNKCSNRQNNDDQLADDQLTNVWVHNDESLIRFRLMLPLRGRKTNDSIKDHWVDSDHPHTSIHTADLRSHIAMDVSLPSIRRPSQGGLTVFFLKRIVVSWHNDDRENGDQQQSFRIK